MEKERINDNMKITNIICVFTKKQHRYKESQLIKDVVDHVSKYIKKDVQHMQECIQNRINHLIRIGYLMRDERDLTILCYNSWHF